MKVGKNKRKPFSELKAEERGVPPAAVSEQTPEDTEEKEGQS